MHLSLHNKSMKDHHDITSLGLFFFSSFNLRMSIMSYRIFLYQAAAARVSFSAVDIVDVAD